MVTKGQVQSARNLADAEALLAQFRSEDKPAHDRIKDIETQIRALRTEIRSLRRTVNAGVTEEDILLRIGQLHDEANQGGGQGGGPPQGQGGGAA